MTRTIVHDVSSTCASAFQCGCFCPLPIRVDKTERERERKRTRIRRPQADMYPILAAIPLKSMKRPVIKRVCAIIAGRGLFLLRRRINDNGEKRVIVIDSAEFTGIRADELLVIVFPPTKTEIHLPGFRGLLYTEQERERERERDRWRW